MIWLVVGAMISGVEVLTGEGTSTGKCVCIIGAEYFLTLAC